MTTFHRLLPEWQAELAKLGALSSSGSHKAWYFQMRARVLRYLISRYGITAATGTVDSPAATDLPSITPALPRKPVKDVRPIRTQREIRSRLDCIRRHCAYAKPILPDVRPNTTVGKLCRILFDD